ncbi:MAG: hypothetical protein INQ03_03890 [Candidatus Heimdallarchaeota archaeon]|nr:hypothetical protein [Candidatus Heimdallarchaeota archaeon]
MKQLIDDTINNYIQNAFKIAMKDLIVSEDETKLLQIIEEECQKIRDIAQEMYGSKQLTEKQLKQYIRELSKGMLTKLSRQALADGRITVDELAIIQVVAS